MGCHPAVAGQGGTSIHQRLSHVCTRSLIYSFIRGDSPEGALMAPVGTDVPGGSLAFRRRREKGWYSLNPMEIHSEMKTGSVSEGVCYGDTVNTTHGGGWLITLRHNRHAQGCHTARNMGTCSDRMRHEHVRTTSQVGPQVYWKCTVKMKGKTALSYSWITGNMGYDSSSVNLSGFSPFSMRT